MYKERATVLIEGKLPKMKSMKNHQVTNRSFTLKLWLTITIPAL